MDLGISQYPIFKPSLSIIYIFQGEFAGHFLIYLMMTLFFFLHQLELVYWFIFKSPMHRAGIMKAIYPLLWVFNNFQLTNAPIIIQTAERYMLKTSPKRYQDVLIPSYRKVFLKDRLGCIVTGGLTIHGI